ncbi:MAG: LacI family DNA-binding transcriptional regulator [Spirochaetales bacterium]|nr:LacI family DNA-binding transcriptional regulator [Spirochaetales bacterium]
MAKRVTIKDIAKEVGVTPSTVSCILNNKPLPFKDETVKEVKKVAREMGYTTNVFARGLVKGTTNTIGFLFMGNTEEPFSNPLVFKIVSQALNALNRKDYSIFFSRSMHFDDPKDVEDHVHSTFSSGRVDGVIIIGPPEHQYHDILLKLKYDLPYVLVGRVEGTRRMNMVDVDNEQMGYCAARHLAETGVERIGYIANEIGGYQFQVDRDKGFRQALKDAGKDVDEELLVQSRTDSSQSKEEKLIKSMIGKVDALYIWNVSVAQTLCQMVLEKKISIPGDFKVIIDEGMKDYLNTQIRFTSIEIDTKKIGVLAAELIDEKLQKGQDHFSQVFIEPILNIGETT